MDDYDYKQDLKHKVVIIDGPFEKRPVIFTLTNKEYDKWYVDSPEKDFVNK